MIGGAGYAYPSYLIKRNKNVNIDVAEIDPELTSLAKKYFGLIESPRLNIYHEDGRIFLNSARSKYDSIFIDAFSAYNVPYHLVTLEAINKMSNSLNDNGIIVANVISSITGGKGKALRAIYKTFKQVFPQVYLFPVRLPDQGSIVQNVMLLAIKSQRSQLSSEDPYINGMLKHVWKKDIEDDVAVLTDDHSPVDQYMFFVYKDIKMRQIN